MRFYGLIIVFLCTSYISTAQQLTGKVYLVDGDRKVAAVGAQVFWEGTTQGTVTDTTGYFSLSLIEASKALIIAYTGYTTDTILVNSSAFIEVTLKESTLLQEVEIQARASFMDQEQVRRVEVLSQAELTKSACCNLSESFETNASVDVSYSDAVTGAKQVRMMGLDGRYLLISVEGIPFVRGLANTYGLQYIPGPWIASIDVGKGVGSAVSSYESMTGHINVELQKPDLAEALYFNAYANAAGRIETNLNLAQPINEKWSGGLLVHASTLQNEVDKNEDTFLDIPTYTHYNVVNRWTRKGENWILQLGVKALYEDRQAGQVTNTSDPAQLPYEVNTQVERLELFSKNTWSAPNRPYRGIGWLISTSHYHQESTIGDKHYQGTQRNVYSNLVYQDILGNTNHTYKLGFTYLLDDYQERYQDSSYTRTEVVPGTFAEYTYTLPEKFTAVAGLRMDFHNLYGTFFTPRLHLKYDLNTSTTVRGSAGSGFRVPNAIAENLGRLVSSRQLIVEGDIQPERAWNYGVNVYKTFRAFDRNASVSIDLYRTDFQDQLVTDLDQSASEIRFYNLRGRSFANSFQVEFNVTPLKQFDMKVAYKWYDVQMTTNGQLQQQIFVSPHKVLGVISYATKFDIWKFDLTTKWFGRQRLPQLIGNPENLQQAVQSPSYLLLNSQVTKAFRKWEAYVGVENLTNFRQENPIIDAQNPFGDYFDAAQVWGPVIGRMFYIGMRFKIK